MVKGVVYDIQRFSLHDGPGIRTILFLKGCPLQCQWCCNPESQLLRPEIMYTKEKCIACKNCVSVCPSGALFLTSKDLKINYNKCTGCGKCVEVCNTEALKMSGKEYTVDEVIPELLRDRSYYQISGGGVTISGGEPLLQENFTGKILKKLKKLGINTAVETSGFAKWRSFKKIIDYTDLFLYDIKHLQNEEHIKGTGKENKVIIDNLKKIIEYGKKVIIRYPLIPDFNIDEKYILEIARFLKKINIKTLHILPYHRLGISKYKKLRREYKLLHLNPPSNRKIKEIQNNFKENTNLKVIIEG